MARLDGSYYADQVKLATKRYKEKHGLNDGEFETHIPGFKKWLNENR